MTGDRDLGKQTHGSVACRFQLLSNTTNGMAAFVALAHVTRFPLVTGHCIHIIIPLLPPSNSTQKIHVDVRWFC